MKKQKINLGYFTKNLLVVVGLVLIWRGVWYILDYFDNAVMGGQHVFSALGGIILGLIILYAPDKDLKEISNL
ncbi:MAG: hypothetical protein QG551_61 [Patescibacteria group bacterium]|jgi:uncharacterized membrane protein HdeD (DUF308 family)|nr:hypothetical protein [Patescibacteria group bacterium]